MPDIPADALCGRCKKPGCDTAEPYHDLLTSFAMIQEISREESHRRFIEHQQKYRPWEPIQPIEPEHTIYIYYHRECLEKLRERLNNDGWKERAQKEMGEFRDAVNKARAFAVKAHGDQKYGNDDRPYVSHLDAVCDIVCQHDMDKELATVAYLHDVLEDTEVTPAQIEGAFGEDVADAVYMCTDPPGANRVERKAGLHTALNSLDESQSVPRLALIVKAADRLANLRESAKAAAAGVPGKLDMYHREHEAFRAAAYRPGLCDQIWDEIEWIIGGGDVTATE
jgi:guanosine-3',5'-bis(diphosphate) 3'-pyrophosphohydrolase